MLTEQDPPKSASDSSLQEDKFLFSQVNHGKISHKRNEPHADKGPSGQFPA